MATSPLENTRMDEKNLEAFCKELRDLVDEGAFSDTAEEFARHLLEAVSDGRLTVAAPAV